MTKAKELKQMLGDRYIYQKLVGKKQVERLKSCPPSSLTDTVIAVLTAGVIKINAVLFRSPVGLESAYDIFVKDSPDSNEWICFDSIPIQVGSYEIDMAQALDDFVREHDLSYTECCFKRLNGKLVKLKEEYKAGEDLL